MFVGGMVGSSRMALVCVGGGSVLALSFCRLSLCRLRSLVLFVLWGLRCVRDVGVVGMRSIMSGGAIGVEGAELREQNRKNPIFAPLRPCDKCRINDIIIYGGR